jgi:hypothetical protein
LYSKSTILTYYDAPESATAYLTADAIERNGDELAQGVSDVLAALE